MNHIEKVREFHKAFGVEDNIRTLQAAVNRLTLLQEELDEFQESFKERDWTGVLDALVDLQYILSGTVLKLGFDKVFEEAFNRVHNANMDKLCSTNEEILESVQSYLSKGIDVWGCYVPEQDKWAIRRNPDQKVLKRKGWTAPDLSDLAA